jgi:hypothetical protein
VLVAAGAMAQPVYRNVDKNGKVTFLGPGAHRQHRAGRGRRKVAVAPSNAGLPYELRQVAQRYPVTLYTGEECALAAPPARCS